jgi:site-specific recombinase XerD
MKESKVDSILFVDKCKILDDYLNSQMLVGRSKKTLQNYRYTILQLFDFSDNFGYKEDQNFYTVKVIEKYFENGILERKWNNYTLWSKYKNLNPFFKWCVKKNFINQNPLLEMEKPKMPEQAPKPLNENEVKELLNVVSNLHYEYKFTKLRNIALIMTFLYSGIRRNELLNLKVENVDLVNGFIEVEHGKGNKRREIPIEQHILKPVLISYMDYRKKLNKSSQWFFNGTFSGHGLHDNQLSVSALDNLFWKVSEIMKIRVTAHRLRHTFATTVLDNTGDLFTLKELMGHNDISTTCVYLKSTRKKKIQVINALSFTQV